jgi:hypothetical protein
VSKELKSQAPGAPERKELFLDDREIEAVDGLVRTFHQPRLYGDGPIITPEFPWEGPAISPATAIFDPLIGKFRLWYQTYYTSTEPVPQGGETEIPLRDERFRYGVGYAESEDGVHFDRPKLGRVSHEGRDTNLAIGGYFSPAPQSCILRLDEPNPAKRYRLYVWDEAPYPGRHSLIGMSLYVSEDGYDWKGYEWSDQWCNDPQPYCYIKMVGQYRYPEHFGPNECNGIFWDEKIGRFVNYCRANNGSVRAIGRMESRDGTHWDPPNLVAMPDLTDPFLYQFYWARPYRSGEFIILYVMTYAPCQGHRCQVEVLASRDGSNFVRVGDRRPWIETGSPGAWNGGMVSAAAPVERDGKLWIYTSGSPQTHDAESTDTGIALYQFRPDGYVSFDAGETEGSFTTRRLVWLYDHLHINASAPRGEIRIEILPGSGRRPMGGSGTCGFDEHYPAGLEGFGKDDCIAFQGDSIDAEVTFGDRRLGDLRGQYVQLRFYLRNAELYSWKVS